MKPNRLFNLFTLALFFLNSTLIPTSYAIAQPVAPSGQIRLASQARASIAKQTAGEQVPDGLSATDWGNIQVLMQQAEYHYTWQEREAAYVAPNRSQGWDTRLGNGGLKVSPGFGLNAGEWDLQLRLAAWGYAGNLVPVAAQPRQQADQGRVTYQWANELSEWYINSERGLEQGFTISRPPATDRQAQAPLMLEMAVESSLQPRLSADRQAVDFVSAAGKTVLRYDNLKVSDALGQPVNAWMEVTGCGTGQPTCSLQLAMEDTAAHYPLTVDPLLTSQVAKLVAADGAVDDLFGQSVAVDGDTIVVGARHADVGSNADQGAAYIFTRNQGGADQWSQVRKLTASDGLAGDQLGWSTAISGDTIVVGARLADVGGNTDQGSAYVFRRNQGGVNQWGQVRKLVASDGVALDAFGVSVAIENNKIVIGAHGADIGTNSRQGAAYIFYLNQGGPDQWGQVRKIIAADGATGDEFGVYADINSDVIVVTAWWDDIGSNGNQGSAYVFYRNQGGADLWGQVRKLTAADGIANDEFGFSVSLDNDTLLVGARLANIGGNLDQGAAYVFSRNQGGSDQWGQVKKLVASDGATSDQYGVRVAISGGTIAVGAYQADVGGHANQGRVYLYERNQGGSEQWGEVAQLAAADGASSDLFGYALAISDNTIVVGAQGHNSSQGAAYTFVRRGNAWEQVAKPIASDGLADDGFGSDIYLHNGTVVIGTRLADVGGNTDQGAAYIFTRNQGGADGWGQVKKLVASDGAAGDQFGWSVSLDDSTIVVGARYADVSGRTDQGAAYVFARNQGGSDQWGQVRKLTASDGLADDQFGVAVAISEDTIAVGAHEDDVSGLIEQGSVYIYYRNQGGADNWGQLRRITGADSDFGDYFGVSLSLSGTVLAVGAYADDVGGNINQGAAYIFYRNQGGADLWGQVRKLTGSGGAAEDRFGWNITTDGNITVVGAPWSDPNGNSLQGAAYIYARNQGGADQWGQVKKLIAADGVAGDRFGASLSLSHDVLVAGVGWVDIGTSTDQGAVHIFERNTNGTEQWGQVDKWIAADGAAGDTFGYSVSLSGNTIAISGMDVAYIYQLETEPELFVSKDVSPTTIAYHGVVTYTLLLSNTGLADDLDAVLTDTLPAEVDFGDWLSQPAGAIQSNDAITWTGVITAGQVITMSFTAIHTGDWGDVITNTAYLRGAQPAITDTATFNVQQGFPLTVTLAGTGSGSVASIPAGIACEADCFEIFAEGTIVSLAATPAISSTFAGWSGACTGLGACSVTITESKHVTATFTLDAFALTVGKDGNGDGTVTSAPPGIACGADCAETYDYGTLVALAATPAISSTFAGWSGACTGLGACSVTITESKHVTATFTLDAFALTVGKDGNGDGTVTSAPPGIACGADCAETYDYGTLVSLTATPAISSTFAGWSGACTGLGACSVTITESKHVTATFVANQLYGYLQFQREAGQVITFTVVVTSPTPQSNLVVTGSIPANTTFVSVSGGTWVPNGGDYGKGYVTTGVISSLMPGEQITLTWSVHVPFSALGWVENQAHARAETASNILHLVYRFYRALLPIICRNTILDR